ncbi:MAG: hypothetical protein HGB08_01680 [Candidatus Moranbacteria bacterium]|nr:hypothetical protein [Candidatus Moranbacteria bacterium]
MNRTKGILAIVIFSAVVFLLLLNTRKTFETEIDMMIVGKNSAIAGNIKPVIGTIGQIVESSSFYSQVADMNGGIDAIDSGMSPYDQRRLWDKAVDVEGDKGSYVFSVKNYGRSGSISKDLNEETVSTLILSIGKYYDIRSEIDLRIIDGPLTRQVPSMNILLMIIWSIVSGIVFYAAVFYFIPWFYFKKPLGKTGLSDGIGAVARKMNFTIPGRKPFEEAPYSFPQEKKKEAPIAAEKNIPQKEEPVIPVMTMTPEKKSGTPDNLPVSEEIPAFLLQKEKEETIEEPATANGPIREKDLTREANAEEVKERLNRLLGGGI